MQAVEDARADGVQVELGGELVRYSERPETGAAEMIGIGAAVVILLMAFGSVIAGGMPIGLALFGLATGFSAVTIVAAFMDVAEVAPILASMIGLGVGIDYALFVITRHRQHLAEGMTVEEAAGAGQRHGRPGRDLRRRHRGHRHLRPGPRRHPVHRHRWATPPRSSSPSW